MIHIITGDFGSGKTRAITARIEEDVKNGSKAILLVPEQETVSVESAMAALLPPSAPLHFEVSNFSRLANTVFRMLGGLSYHYADRGTRALCLWRAMREVQPYLHEGQGDLELGRVRRMAAAMRELSALSLTPEDLARAAAEMTDTPHLKEKLEDLSLIATRYRDILTEKYDDAETDLDRLYTQLIENAPLAGTHIYVDGFVSFTEQQWKVLRALSLHCDLCVTLTLPKARADNPAFLETAKTYARLYSLKGKGGVKLTHEDLGAPKRAKNPRLTEALTSLFDGNAAPVCSENGETGEKTATPDTAALAAARVPLRLLCAEDAMAECEWIATDILRRVMQDGAHYRDFAIIARRAEQYTGILDTVFSAASIPHFMSKHTDVSAYAAIKLIYTAYAVCTANWRQGDVISYCKCGLSGIPQDDVDVFELYVSRWKLNGARFTSDEEWTMNPDGYTPTWTEQGRDTLARAEAVRKTLLAQLIPLSDSCHRASVRAHAKALYAFLSSIDLEKTLALRAEEARVSRNLAEADELSRLFAVICDALDRLVDCMGDTELGTEEFVDLLRLLFGEVSLSRIPSSLDEVTVGSADLIRIGRAKHVYLLGVNEGEFPAPALEDSIFTDGDRAALDRKLSDMGLDISVQRDLFTRASRELFCFARAFAAGSESVCLLYADKTLGGAPLKPASLLTPLAARFFLPVIRLSDLPPIERLWSRALSEDRLGLLVGTAEGLALTKTLSADEAGKVLCDRLEYPLVREDCKIAPATAKALFGEKIYLSQSRIDSFNACPFSYFCQYVLKLDAAKEITFDYSDIGNLLHTILEKLFAHLAQEGKEITDLSEEALLSIVDTLIADYVSSICPAAYLRTAKMDHIVRTLRRAFLPVVSSLYEEFSQSRFRPTFFELNLNEKGEDSPGGIPYVLPNGTPIIISGRIDRVDTWQKDGKTYLRVVDYKSGDKRFSLDDVQRGLNLQLLVYLFSLWKSENPRFKEKLGGELLPAGALYTAARAKDSSYDGPVNEEKVSTDSKKSVYRSGLLLDDREMLEAMDPGLSGRFIPVSVTKKNEYSSDSQKSLATYEKMGELVGELERVILHIGEEMQGGNAAARPQAAKGKKLPCTYCEMAPVCRASRKEPN